MIQTQLSEQEIEARMDESIIAFLNAREQRCGLPADKDTVIFGAKLTNEMRVNSALLNLLHGGEIRAVLTDGADGSTLDHYALHRVSGEK